MRSPFWEPTVIGSPGFSQIRNRARTRSKNPGTGTSGRLNWDIDAVCGMLHQDALLLGQLLDLTGLDARKVERIGYFEVQGKRMLWTKLKKLCARRWLTLSVDEREARIALLLLGDPHG